MASKRADRADLISRRPLALAQKHVSFVLTSVRRADRSLAALRLNMIDGRAGELLISAPATYLG